eukprot:CAMPEP_0179376716 /NCGR_PEP_ID=MMETSP0797-20121207/88461_1 /TAXON_ID=47934 /ORGANISM="Dinophysis acuminata, Strain DAEP01" /LENGTH=148 /DNA_ID=CAMNT_0021092761 /DNA_START=78 /DNA_END=524 /DNA_ORIENTATION=-
MYCSEHFKYEAHACPKGRAANDRRVVTCSLCGKGLPYSAGEDVDAVRARHAASGDCCPAPPANAKPRCPVKGCKEKLTTLNSLVCGTCKQKVCLKHRFEDAHDCRPGRPLGCPFPDMRHRHAASSCRQSAAPGDGGGGVLQHVIRPVK